MPLKTFHYGGSFNDHDQPAWMGDMEVRCAWHECSNIVSRDNSYSFIVSFMTRGPDSRLGSFQCPDIDDVLAGHLHAQHFCCSGECAVKAAHACIDEHLVPQHNAHVDALAQHDAAIAAEQAAMEAHKQEQARQAALQDGSDVAQFVQQTEPKTTHDDGPPTLLSIPVVPAAPVASTPASDAAPVETIHDVAHDEGETDNGAV